MLKALKSCHDEQLFIWSSKTATVGDNLDSTGEEFPSGYGIEFGDGFYMMMVIYEYIDTELIDDSGKNTYCQYNRRFFLKIVKLSKM